jgi:FtsP/CotA-like multicopper oxidase with cupredoxin domain
VSKDRVRLLLACLATVVVVLPLGWFWQHSRVPSTYSVMDMGYLDYGGGPHVMPTMGGGRSVASLTAGTHRPADEVVHLTARKAIVRLADHQRVDGYTLNGRSPGPVIEVTEGQLLEVHLRNADVPDGITLHWHGMDVPNAEDGVAGVTQDAVLPGHTFTYRFVARRAGTYWYHSHQVSHEQVIGGLLGAVVVRPRHPDRSVQDVVAVVHTYDGVATLNGLKELPVLARPGQRVRVRVVNSDNGPTRTWAGTPFRVVAVDGYDIHRPTQVAGRAVTVTAGGRVDLELVAPRDGHDVRVQVGAATSVLIGRGAARVPAPPPPTRLLDLLSYGSPAPLGFDPGRATRHFTYDIGRSVGFVKGRPGLFWTVDGHLFPHLPMFVVRQGDVVRMHIENHSGDVHPMHLHGHHAVVLERNGVRATGSPWWFDSLNVENGESYDVAFVADNPGIWMDHCHNLRHAQQGLVTHLMYAGVREPYRIGDQAGNEPE